MEWKGRRNRPFIRTTQGNIPNKLAELLTDRVDETHLNPQTWTFNTRPKWIGVPDPAHTRGPTRGLRNLLYRVDRNLAGDVMEPVLWTLYTYVGGLRFDQDLALLEIKLGFQGKPLTGRWCAGRIFMVSSTNILN